MKLIDSSNPTKFAEFISMLEAQARADIAAKRPCKTLVSEDTMKITNDTIDSESYRSLINVCYRECLEELAVANSGTQAKLAFIREFQIAIGLGFRYAQYLQDTAGDSLQPAATPRTSEQQAQYLSDSERIRLENMKIDGGVN